MGSKDDPSLNLGPFASLPKVGEERTPDLGPFAGLPSAPQPESLGSNLTRGIKESFQQVPQLGYGLLAGAGAAVESAAGEGGIGTGIKQFAVQKYNEWEQKIQSQAQDTDSWDYSWDQAKQGNFSALAAWIAHGIGYTGGQGIQMLLGAGAGTLAGKAALGTVADTIAQGLVRKEAIRLAQVKAGEAATADQVVALAAQPEMLKAATSAVAGNLGQMAAVGASSFAQEGGQIFGQLTQDAEKEGRTLSGSQLGTALWASVLAGGLEFVGDKLGLDVVLGKSPILKLAETAGAKGGMLSAIGGRLARGGIAAAAEAPAEAATEYFQSGLEQYGSGEDKSILPWNQSEENQRQARESAMLGALGGVVMGGAGGAIHGAHQPTEVPAPAAPTGEPPLLLPAPTGMLGSSAPRPVVQFPDGTYGTVEDAQNFINAQVAAAPADQQEGLRQSLEEQLIGVGRPQPTPAEIAAKTGGRATVADILNADTSAGIEEAIELAQRAVGYRTGLAAIDVEELNVPTLTDELTGKGLFPELPVGEATEVDLANVRAPLLPVGEATEMLPVGEATEVHNIPVGEVSDVTNATEQWAAAEQGMQRMVDAARIQRILDGDLLTRDGMPYGSKTAALLRAKKEGLSLDHVVEIPDAGWVVRPNLTVKVAEQAPMQPVQGQPANAPGFTAQNTPGVLQQQPGATTAQPGETGTTGASQPGFIDAPNGYQVRITQHVAGSNVLDPNADHGAFIYEVRKGPDDPTPLTLVLNKDGKLVVGKSVLTNNESNGTAWVPSTPDVADTIRSLLQRRAATTVGSPERQAIDRQIRDVVTQDVASPGATGEIAAPGSAEQPGTGTTGGPSTPGGGGQVTGGAEQPGGGKTEPKAPEQPQQPAQPKPSEVEPPEYTPEFTSSQVPSDVNIELEHEGETKQVNARQALKLAEQRIANLRQLLDCVRAG